MKNMTENRLNDVAPAAIFQVHERCFIPPLSEFWTYQNAKWRHGPPENRLWPTCWEPL